MFDVIAIGGAARDTTFLTDKGRVVETPENPTEQRLLGFEYAAKIRSEEVYINFGGGACNAAATFAKMGLVAAVCARVGSDEIGKAILENLKQKGIDAGLVQQDEGQHSGFSFVVINRGGGGERVIFVHKGSNCNLKVDREKITETSWIYLTALAGEDWKDSLAGIYEAAKASGVKIAWNPGWAEIKSGKSGLEEFIKRTDVLIVNKDEAIELVESARGEGLSKEDLNDAGKLARIMKGWGAEMVAVTDGKNGAHLASGDELFRSPAHLGKQMDTTGAGDAFGAGLSAGYIFTGDVQMALKFGILNSSGTVSEYGAQNGIMTRQEVESKLELINVDKL